MTLFCIVLLLLVELVPMTQGLFLPVKVVDALLEEMPLIEARVADTNNDAEPLDVGEWFHRSMMVNDRTLQAGENESCDDEAFGACAFVSFFMDDVDVYSDCGGLSRKVDNAWVRILMILHWQ